VIDVLYEDDVLLFVDKPPQIVVQRAHDPDEPVLFELAAAHAGGSLFLLQRLDRGTSGVIFFSKDAAINGRLTRQFEKRQIRKRYLALCEGEIAERQTIDAPLARIGAIKFGVRERGRRAVTRVEPLASIATASFVSIGLETGRTHQIRVHLAAIGHPLVGDWLYGERNAARPMLHAASIEMPHPITRQLIRIESALPGDFIGEAERRGLMLPAVNGVTSEQSAVKPASLASPGDKPPSPEST
jgi:RluA family pseudouridine synthase